MLIRCFIPFDIRPTFWSAQSDIFTSERTVRIRSRRSEAGIPRRSATIPSASFGVREG